MEAVGNLAGGIAHDFNNILQVVLGFSQVLLQQKKEGEADYSRIEKIYNAGQRGADLVKNLMMFSRHSEPVFLPTNLNHEVLQVRDLLSQTIPKTINVDINLEEDLKSIQADRSQLGQILMNLAVNARDAMPNGGTLRIETANVELDKEYCSDHIGAKPGSHILLTVSDTGQGMDKETLAHIFEPFFTTKEVGKGTGLGLATVHGIVNLHGGHMECYSEICQGATFKVYFPAIQTEQDMEAPTSETPIPGGTETVLLVDDDDAVRDWCQELLGSFGYEVITAGNGKEAVEMCQTMGDSISLVILDLIMPVMDGRQCLAEILRIKPSAKVIIASGYSESGPTSRSMTGGAKGFVEKPYNESQLLTTIRKVLDQD
jgi:CheY-like chemotaxis protein/two-component sensor histidine kinase